MKRVTFIGSFPCLIPAMLLLLLQLTGCQGYFDYTPYGIETTQHELTAKNAARIVSQSQPAFQLFRFAVIADTHAYYEQLDDFVNHLNRRSDLAFVLIAGDLTDYGMLQEYQWSVDILQRLTIPWLTTIGNHDALNNGKENYRAFFGPFDYTFTFNQVKFVVLNSASWEFDHYVPNLDWLTSELAGYYLYQHQMVLTHVLPQNSRFPVEFTQAYIDTLESHFVSLVAGGDGHTHNYEEKILSNGQAIGYLTTGTLKDRHYVVVSVEASSITITQVSF